MFSPSWRKGAGGTPAFVERVSWQPLGVCTEDRHTVAHETDVAL